MQFSKYEETFTNVNDVQGSAAKYADQVANIIRNAKDGITCKEIGIKLFGEHEYNKWGRSHASELGHVLSNLADGHFIKFEKVETGEVLTWEEHRGSDPLDTMRLSPSLSRLRSRCGIGLVSNLSAPVRWG